VRGTDLSKANLCDALLNGANLNEVTMRATNCTGANLQTAQLFGAVLTHSVFINADLQRIQATSREFADVDIIALYNVLIDPFTAQRLGIDIAPV
jgi:uncharacterized protein YjbI with pentapeptide repeats